MKITCQIDLWGARKVNSASDITKDCRLFYELGHYVITGKYKDKEGNIVENKRWVRKGVFKEIQDVQQLLENDIRLSDKEFIDHHNFVVIYPQDNDKSKRSSYG